MARQMELQWFNSAKGRWQRVASICVEGRKITKVFDPEELIELDQPVFTLENTPVYLRNSPEEWFNIQLSSSHSGMRWEPPFLQTSEVASSVPSLPTPGNVEA